MKQSKLMKKKNEIEQLDKPSDFWFYAGLLAILLVSIMAHDIGRPFYGLHSCDEASAACSCSTTPSRPTMTRLLILRAMAPMIRASPRGYGLRLSRLRHGATFMLNGHRRRLHIRLVLRVRTVGVR